VGDSAELSSSFGRVVAAEEKKLATNEYSVVALSIRTRNIDRNKASIGSFCP
jgi:hypothetical protein